MNKYLFKISTKLKDEIKDPQGEVAEKIISRLKIADSANVRVGKFYEVTIFSNTQEEATIKINKIAREILTNPIVEIYNIESFEVE